MSMKNTNRKKIVYVAILSIGLGLSATNAMARTVDGGSKMCEAARTKSAGAVGSEIEAIKKTHEIMEIDRSVHAECMKQINKVVGEQISSINSGDGSILGTIGGVFGELNTIFDLSGKVCTAIKDKVSDKQKKIAEQIRKAEPLLSKAAEIAKQGKDAIGDVDGKYSEIKKAIDEFNKSQAQKAADHKYHSSIEAGETKAPEGYKKPPGYKDPSTKTASNTPASSASFMPQTKSATASPSPTPQQQSAQASASAVSGPPPVEATNPLTGASKTWSAIGDLLNNR